MLSPSPLSVLAPSDKSAVAVEDIVAAIESTTQRFQKVMDQAATAHGSTLRRLIGDCSKSVHASVFLFRHNATG